MKIQLHERDFDKILCEFSMSQGVDFHEDVLNMMVDALTENVNELLERKQKAFVNTLVTILGSYTQGQSVLSEEDVIDFLNLDDDDVNLGERDIVNG